MPERRWPSRGVSALLALLTVAGCTSTEPPADPPDAPAPVSPTPVGQSDPDIPFVAFRDLPAAERAPQQTAPQMTAVAPPAHPTAPPTRSRSS